MMLNLSKMLHSKSGKYLLSIILGLGLASLFRRLCKDNNCIVFYAPPFDEIKDKIYKEDGKCYTFTPVTTKCNPNKQQVEIENKELE